MTKVAFFSLCHSQSDLNKNKQCRHKSSFPLKSINFRIAKLLQQQHTKKLQYDIFYRYFWIFRETWPQMVDLFIYTGNPRHNYIL